MKSNLIVFVLLFLKYFVEAQEQPCATIPCVLSAATLIEKLNSAVDPCENFYEYACGTFEEEVSTPDEKSTVDTISIMKDNLNEFLLTVLTSDKHDELEGHKIAKQFYAACSDTRKFFCR